MRTIYEIKSRIECDQDGLVSYKIISLREIVPQDNEEDDEEGDNDGE